MRSKKFLIVALTFVLLLTGFGIASYSAMQPMPHSFSEVLQAQDAKIFLDRDGKRLQRVNSTGFNTSDIAALYELPPLFLKALILAEDKHFFSHNGVDWKARFAAMMQNLHHHRITRGASTITEQVVRMLHPRKRTYWTKWIEGLEAMELEKRFSKTQILHFYINQVPYAANKRGIKQAALYYFNRDITTLNEKELLTLVVLIRSPKWYDPKRHLKHLEKQVNQLAFELYKNNQIDKELLKRIESQKLSKHLPKKGIVCNHFLDFVTTQLGQTKQKLVHTTLDSELQQFLQDNLNHQLERMQSKNVHNGAIIVIDHVTNEVLAWVVAFEGKKNKPFNAYDAVRIARQPGSSLKPFVYALALQKGWEASTLIEDAPLQEGVGIGSHEYHNYSNRYYGLITLRQALGNSLNIPAIKTIQYVGVEPFLSFLKSCGITTLQQHPNYYGDGIALGNSEVTLYELARAYSVLGRMGIYKDIKVYEAQGIIQKNSKRVLPEKIASVLADILSDPAARQKEFGRYSILNLTHQTAIKTGTSTDYRDAWCMGFDDRYTVGVWFGNLDAKSMKKVTGSSGPAHILKSAFAYLTKRREPHPLYVSPELKRTRLCISFNPNKPDECSTIDEFQLHDTNATTIAQTQRLYAIVTPSPNLVMAKDPRIPDDVEYYRFRVSADENLQKVQWYSNGKMIAQTKKNWYDWKVERGRYHLSTKTFLQDGSSHFDRGVDFYVQ